MTRPAGGLDRARFLRLTLSAIGLAAIAFAWIWLMQRDFFYDARAYWSLDYADLYGDSLVGRFGTYLYSPAFAQAMWPLTLLPWAVFAGLWCALNLGLLLWMVGPVLAALLLFIPYSPVTDEITTGNIHIILAAVIVVGFRFPGAHAFSVLTKLTPGVALLWFAGAGRMRQLAIALGVAAAITAVSFAIGPNQWFDWLRLLRESSGVPPGDRGVIPGPLWLRAAAAAVLVLAGGRLRWRWTVSVAVAVSLPVTWSSGMSVLVALIPLYRARADAVWRRWRPMAAASRAP